MKGPAPKPAFRLGHHPKALTLKNVNYVYKNGRYVRGRPPATGTHAMPHKAPVAFRTSRGLFVFDPKTKHYRLVRAGGAAPTGHTFIAEQNVSLGKRLRARKLPDEEDIGPGFRNAGKKKWTF